MTNNQNFDRLATKEQCIELIAEGLTDAEVAIRNHASNVVLVYEKGKAALLEGQSNVKESEWSRSTGLSLHELAIVNQYLFAMSFISAWYHVHSYVLQKHKAQKSACDLASTVGITPSELFVRYLKYERTWRVGMKSAGIGNRKRTIRIVCLAIALIGIAWLIFH